MRERDWVLLPSEDQNLLRLRPLTGVTEEVTVVDRRLSDLIKDSIPEESPRPSQFPPPSPENITDATGAQLLWQAARMALREGAAPFRSLGHISIRPRVYQYVPLLMALRLDPVRLFIADDVGVGKTIEALLVARELLDRGEVRRMAVLCPPYLCDQWEKELREKFNLEAVVIRSSTIGQLERNKPADASIYEHYPIQLISIDWVKSKRNRHQFLQFCPELVIVDEAHGAADNPNSTSQQQRHQLLREIAKDDKRHLILLSATPHSGIETAFSSLLGLLKPEFGEYNVGNLSQSQRIELAKHFVQRTRKDIEKNWAEEHGFPKRTQLDAPYQLSDTYLKLFRQTHAFASEIIRDEDEAGHKRRVRYWGALALLRAVMSSPKAAEAALQKQADKFATDNEQIEEADFQSTLFEASNEGGDDEIPVPLIKKAQESLGQNTQRSLTRLAKLARKLQHSEEDQKLNRAVDSIRRLVEEDYHPIVWCRYVATAEYVGDALRKALGKNVQVTVVTGRYGDEERRAMIDAIDPNQPRVLVATDCLSEGINLQEKFNAVLHYDLPWNPNRLEQREGRVDRYGQTAGEVKAVHLYGEDNPVDGAVLEVLLKKARDIHKALGTYVPVPDQSESVMEAVFHSLFKQPDPINKPYQQTLFREDVFVQDFHKRWDQEVERERINRTRFAQRALKPEEVQRELEAADKVLGDPSSVQEFVLSVAQRLGLGIRREASGRGEVEVFQVDVSPGATATLPEAVRMALPEKKGGTWNISFFSPTPAGAEYVGRNHRFVTTLARYLLEEALTKDQNAVASRCGVVRTRAVDELTNLLLLRVRYLLEIPGQTPLLSEEVLVTGYRGLGWAETSWLDDDEALRLLGEAAPDANIPPGEKRELAEAALSELGEWSAEGQRWGQENDLQKAIRSRIFQRAKELEESHKRVRKAVSLRVRELRVTPQLPPDLLGLLVLQPVVKP